MPSCYSATPTPLHVDATRPPLRLPSTNGIAGSDYACHITSPDSRGQRDGTTPLITVPDRDGVATTRRQACDAPPPAWHPPEYCRSFTCAHMPPLLLVPVRYLYAGLRYRREREKRRYKERVIEDITNARPQPVEVIALSSYRNISTP